MATGLISDTLKKVTGQVVDPTIAADVNSLPGEYKTNLSTIAAPAAPSTVTPQQTVAGVPTPSTPQARTITSDETVSGRLNALLSGGSPYVESARNRGIEQANQRGLINSSLAAGTAERAAIDAALPIAQQDASTSAQSGFSAQQAQQDIGLTGYKGMIDSAQQAENFGYRTQENAQNIAANTALQDSRIALDLSRLNETQRTAVSTAASPILQQTMSEIAQIQRVPDQQMSPKAKELAIYELNETARTRIQTLASLYGYQLDWPTETDPAIAQEAERLAAERKAEEERILRQKAAEAIDPAQPTS